MNQYKLKERRDSRSESDMPGRSQMVAGRDELNLAEFPLASLSHWVPAGQKSLVFEDTIWDKGQKRHVTRRLTVAASDKYGLPTALDDEVIFGLVQLTKATEFENRTVPFSRYELARLLGWQDGGKSYRRLEESLKRWLGVTLYYENAWWDKRNLRWADVHFHLLDNLVLFRRRSGKPSALHNDRDALRSSFTWNEVVFRSFQAGYLKQIDLDLYRTLTLATAKRMYRFLDKRFHFSCRLEFDLTHFAHEHIGLSRCYDVAQLKRRLNPAVRELESVGFLEPMETNDRYRRVHQGLWQVVFAARRRTERRSPRLRTDLSEMLSQRGVTAASAARLVRRHAEHFLREKIQVFDELIRRNDPRVSRNPAGYLVQSIRDDYQLPNVVKLHSTKPTDYRHRVRRVDETATVPAKSRKIDDDFRIKRQNRVREYLSRLSPGEFAELEQVALAAAPRVAVDGYRRAKAAGNGQRLEHYRQIALLYHVEHLLNKTVSNA